jgi:hypothetical protein
MLALHVHGRRRAMLQHAQGLPHMHLQPMPPLTLGMHACLQELIGEAQPAAAEIDQVSMTFAKLELQCDAKRRTRQQLATSTASWSSKTDSVRSDLINALEAMHALLTSLSSWKTGYVPC